MRSQASGKGTIKGKLAYMSPEQVRDQAVDSRTDIFAAGVVLWEALTGKRLFFAADPRETVDLLLTSTIVPPTAIVPELPSEIDRVVLKALARDPEKRFATAHDFAEALRKAADEGSRRAVADWVGHVAKDSLSQRLELLETLEESAIHAQAESELPSVSASSPFNSAISSSEGAGTQATSTRAILPFVQVSPVVRWRSFATAIGGIAAMVTTWALLTRHPPEQPPPAPTKIALAATPVIERAVPATSADAPVPLQVESLPLAVASSGRPNLAPTKRRLSVATEARTTHAKACTPPYRIDGSGVRRVKLECL
jgi:serine/threonine-protein kinase